MKSYALRLFVILGFFLLVTPVSATGNTLDLTSSSNYNLRFDGPAASVYGGIGWDRSSLADINNNGIDDLIITSGASATGGSNSGAVYIIYDSLLETLNSEGSKNFDLSVSSNYTVRIDGIANSYQGFYTIAGNILGTSANELLISSSGYDDTQSRTNNGAVYIISNAAISGYGTTTGNSFSLSDTSKWNYRIDGAVSGDYLTYPGISDINNDGLMDVLVGASYASNPTTESGSVYVLMNSLFPNTSTGNTLDLNTSSNYTLRIDGVEATYGSLEAEKPCDLDGDGQKEIIISTAYGVVDKGATYILENSMLNLTGTGTTMALSSGSNYTVRYVGASGSYAYAANLNCHDNDGDGKDDLNFLDYDNNTYFVSGALISSYFGSTNQSVDLSSSSNYTAISTGFFSEALGLFDFTNDGVNDFVRYDCCQSYSGSNFGTTWIESLSMYTSLVGTGNTLTLNDSDKYYARFDGGGPYSYVRGVGDMNGDDKSDMMFISDQTDNNSRTNSGSVWIVFNFPHSISATSVTTPTNNNTPTVTGTVTATGSVTTISGVEYQTDSNDPTGTWTACTAADGTFDETTEDYSCAISALSEGDHTVYFRAYDENTSYTAQANYASVDITVDSSSATFPLVSVAMTENSATITYTSNEAISTQLEWGTSTSYGTTTTETDTSPRVTSHSVSLSNLTKCTDYHLRLF